MKKTVPDSQYLSQQPADDTVATILYEQHFIDATAKDYALKLIYPTSNWKQWTLAFLKYLGYGCIVAGLILIFSQHWSHMREFHKWASIILIIVMGLYGGWIYWGQRENH